MDDLPIDVFILRNELKFQFFLFKLKLHEINDPCTLGGFGGRSRANRTLGRYDYFGLFYRFPSAEQWQVEREL